MDILISSLIVEMKAVQRYRCAINEQLTVLFNMLASEYVYINFFY